MNNDKKVLFLGDVVPYKKFIFRNSVNTVFNLECPITHGGKPVTGKINLSVRDNYLRSTFNENLLAVCLANNHILDYGLEGLDSTLRELEGEGIKYFGLNKPREGTLNPLVFELDGIKVAMMASICESTNPTVEFDDFYYLSLLDLNDITCRIEKVRNEVERVIVFLHWGEEESSLPLKEDILKARKIIDAGADIIIGSHGHAPQPVEVYGNGLIAYNLGNFIMPAFDEMPSYYNDEGVSQSAYSKRLMTWNRISWGLEVNLETMEHRLRKFAFFANRIVELKSTPLDDFTTLHPDTFNDSYDSIVRKHLQKRAFRRRFFDFVTHPHIPGRFKKQK